MIFPGESEDEESLAQIWEEAAQVIREREEVVFIGYSLPTYDAPAREFFRRSTEGKAVEVYTRSVDVLKKYRKFLSGANIVTTRPISFEDCPYALRLCK